MCRPLVVALAALALLVSAAEAQTPRPGAGPGAPQFQPVLIKELTVEGHRRVQQAVILGRVRSAVGAPFNPSQASEDIRSIFNLGFFDDVQLKVEDFEGGVKVTYVVVERPFVRDVEFVGGSRIGRAAARTGGRSGRGGTGRSRIVDSSIIQANIL